MPFMAQVAKYITRVKHKVDVAERAARLQHRGAVVWLTGLPASGKSTLAMELERRLFADGVLVYTLDGDNIRHGLNSDLGFSPQDRRENIRRVGEVAALIADSGVVCVTALISPYRADRARARAAAKATRFYEVYVKANLETCELRDPKGLYAKARRGDLRGMTGVDAPYEVPEDPDILIDTDTESIGHSVQRLLAFVRDRVRLSTSF